MPQVTFILEDGKELTHYVASGAVLLEVAQKSNIAIAAPCSGNITCGKCKVKLLEGNLESPISRHISIDEYEHGYRLACMSKVTDNVKVQILDDTSALKDKIKIHDLRSPEEISIFENEIKLINNWDVVSLSIEKPTPQDNIPDSERLIQTIKKSLGNVSVEVPYFVMKKLSDILREDSFNINCIFSKKDTGIVVYDITTAMEDIIPAGIAIDIGTTSVSSVLINLLDGSILARSSSGNAQAAYGTDVLSRIKESAELGGRNRLQTAIIENTINPMISNMCEFAGITSNSIVEISVASNTIMNHLFMGFNVQNVQEDPYVPAFYEMDNVIADNLNINTNPNASIKIAPNIGSWVGGDITAGLLASKMWNSEELSLFINLGTNGEIVLGNKDSLVSCASYSTVPALIGGNANCRMRATDGAIESCHIDEKTLEPSIKVMGNKETQPLGICGCGIIDLISELYRCKIIDQEGKFIKEGNRVIRDDSDTAKYVVVDKKSSASGKDILITENDICNFLHAKGAMYTAINTLVKSANVTLDKVKNVYISGGIGNTINIQNAFRIGMFPHIPLESFNYIGNASLIGAYEIATSEEAKEKVRQIAREMSYIELHKNDDFLSEFPVACRIPDDIVDKQ